MLNCALYSDYKKFKTDSNVKSLDLLVATCNILVSETVLV